MCRCTVPADQRSAGPARARGPDSSLSRMSERLRRESVRKTDYYAGDLGVEVYDDRYIPMLRITGAAFQGGCVELELRPSEARKLAKVRTQLATMEDDGFD